MTASLVVPAATPAVATTTTVSYVDTTKTTYDKNVIMVNGKPFFHSGVQFRYEKLKYTYGWTDAQLEPIMKMVADDGFKVVNIPIWWSKIETSKDVFDWTDLDKYIDWANKYGLKVELLWYGADSTGISYAPRIPSYVLNTYQYVVNSSGTRIQLGTNYLLDKTDPNLLDREKYVLGQVMSHIATYDTNQALIGVQVENEPNVANMQWGASTDRSYSSYSNTLWTSGGYTNVAQFRRDVLMKYLNALGQVIKQSDHSVYTRVNVVGDAIPVAENEALRSAGQSYIDFIGGDPYTTDLDTLYNYGLSGTFVQGKNLPMIMETYAGSSVADIAKFNALAGNAPMNMYAAVDPDSTSGVSDSGLYNFDPTTHVVTRKTVSYSVAALNQALNKISTDLATRAPIEAGGSTLQTFNRKATTSVTNLSKALGTTNVVFSTSQAGQGIAVKRGPKEYAFLATKASTFSLPSSLGTVSAVETGSYDSNNTWSSGGAKSYVNSGGNITVQLSAGEVVRVTFT
ncbi:DUF4978 domain-containing protein [Leifsonia sp. AG29]|uniref:DUF4978 domain-containing protein n=1 Tax=Leifsonia sp. AG29 TaxID=2598860 RepID=UPI00131E499F|nr:DUF4978 domain-containing protein [Leifsonia sp. AG29]